jgi:hypothetical protein
MARLVREHAARPAKQKGVPAKIPDWAWEAEKRILALATRNGMGPTERKLSAWSIDTPRKGSRPKTPKPLAHRTVDP